MNKKIHVISMILVVMAVVCLTACSSTAANSSTTSTAVETSTSNQPTETTPVATSPEVSAPPSGSLPGGAPPGDSAGSASSDQALSTATGAYTVDGESESQSGQTYTASNQDESGVYVINGGDLTLSNSTVTTSGDSSSNDNSSFYGLNAGVLATGGSTINMFDSSISTTGSGANGAFATGDGTSVTLSDVTINATGGGGHGVMVTLGGSMTLIDVDITTSGANSAPIATDRGGGTITATGGTITTSGQDSPCLYSTGQLTITGITCTATGSESAVIEGANSITIMDSSLASSVDAKWGVMIYQSMSGDAQGAEGVFNMSGGSLANTATTGPLFFVTNSTAYITLAGVDASAASGVLVEAGGTDRWGTSGSNGGTVNLTMDGQSLNGDLVTDDELSSIITSLQNGSSLTGAINPQNSAKEISLTLDATSYWNVTADSYITCLNDQEGISGSSVNNITGNGHTVYYNSNACTALAGQTYNLVGGGYIKPSE